MHCVNAREAAGLGFEATVDPMNFEKTDESASTKTDVAKTATIAILDDLRAIVKYSEKRRKDYN